MVRHLIQYSQHSIVFQFQSFRSFCDIIYVKKWNISQPVIFANRLRYKLFLDLLESYRNLPDVFIVQCMSKDQGNFDFLCSFYVF